MEQLANAWATLQGIAGHPAVAVQSEAMCWLLQHVELFNIC
jgi:hypothetical protein